MAVTTFNIDKKTDETLEALKEHYHASSKAEVLRKAIAFLSVASQHEQADGSILLIQEKGEKLKVVMK